MQRTEKILIDQTTTFMLSVSFSTNFKALGEGYFSQTLKCF